MAQTDSTKKVDNTTKLDIEQDTQDPVDDTAHLVKPTVTTEPMTTNVTIPVQRVKHLPGDMSVITTSAGQLIVPGVAYVNGVRAPEVAPNEFYADGSVTEVGDSTVTVTAAYARSQGLI